MYYVADTHSLIWYLTDDKRLSKNAYSIFEKCDKGEEIIVLPTIVLAETIYICEKKKSKIEFKLILEKINNSSNYQPFSLNMNIILKIKELTQISDIHDRIIIATTSLTDGILITKDRVIRNSRLVETLW